MRHWWPRPTAWLHVALWPCGTLELPPSPVRIHAGSGTAAPQPSLHSRVLDPDPYECCRLPDDLPFDAWVNYVFDHPILDPQWWWQDPESGHLQEWNSEANPARTLSHLTRLFREPQGLVDRFTRPQIDQGLNLLVSPACSNHMSVLADARLPWPDRRACFDAMIPLYAKLMAPVYQDDLGHTQREPGDPERPTYACYMWWDVIPLYGGMDHSDRDWINDAVLRIFEQVLKLRAESCLESVLHGLGHWHLYIPERTEPIVRRFLSRTDISPALCHYAHLAATGNVL